MYDTAIAGLKAATPKIIAGGFLGLPLTAVVGPTAGLIAVGALGVICIGGYLAAMKTVHPNPESNSVSIPAI